MFRDTAMEQRRPDMELTEGKTKIKVYSPEISEEENARRVERMVRIAAEIIASSRKQENSKPIDGST